MSKIGDNGTSTDCDFWWLPEKPQIKYNIETYPKENKVGENEEENGREPNKGSQEEKRKPRNKTKLQNHEARPTSNLKWVEIPTSIPTNHTLPEVGQIMDTRWSKIPVRQGSLISRENKEQRQEVLSSSPL